MAKPVELTANQLRRVSDPESLGFDTTANLPTLTEVLGQPRAVAALSFGTSIASHGFNLFAMGLTGSGKTTLIREYLERRAASQPVPSDYCYVYNFSNPRSPMPLRLPPGGAISTVALLAWFPVLFITFLAAIYALLKIPALTNHIFSGTAGGSSAGLLGGLP